MPLIHPLPHSDDILIPSGEKSPSIRKKERKSSEIPKNRITCMDADTTKTLDKLLRDKTYEVYLEPNDEEDFMIHNADNTVTRVRCFNLNGVSWNIPTGVKARVPKSIKDFIAQNNADKQNYTARLRPGEMAYYGEWRRS